MDYIQGQWLADIEDYQRKLKAYNEKYQEYESLNAIYTKIFRIYNKSRQFGEEYELAVGVGLLSNKASSGTVKIYRHVMTQQVHIKVKYLNEKLELLVRPNADKLPLIETDSIIDLQPQFDQNNIIDAKTKAEELIHEKEIASVFDNNIHDALRIFAQRFCSQGDYFEQNKKPAEEGKKPKIYFSPALLLRKRNTKSLSALYKNIIENISNADDSFDIPSINDLINNDGNTINTSQNDNFSDETIFFPDKYNDEQIQIIEKARRSNKVLVQGPPGTGKSHTIANLICHLLAHGNKVLVTAYTQRALEVLKDKLPEEFQKLTVNLLGGDASSIQGLDNSVNTISRELSQADLPVRKYKIEELEQKLSETREQKAFNINELIKIKEKATRNQKINSFYQGTLLEIAEQLETDSENLEWYKDEFCDIENTEVSSDLASFTGFVTEYGQVDVSELNCFIPEENRLPTTIQLSEHKANLKQLEQIQPSIDEHITIDNVDYTELVSKLQSLADYYTQISTIRNNTTQKLIKPYLQGDTDQFKENFNLAKTILNQIESNDLKQIDNDIEIIYISENSVKQLKKDAQILLKFLKKGNTLQGLFFTLKKPFLSAQIKERLYLIEGIKVNGSPCDTKEEFEAVLRDITLQQDFIDISQKLWKIDLSKKTSYQDKLLYLKNFISDTTKLFTLIDESEILRSSIYAFSKIQIDAFDIKRINLFIQQVEYNDLIKKISEFERILQDSKDYLNQDNLHSIAKKILDDIEVTDVNSYSDRLRELEVLADQQKRYVGFLQLKNKLVTLLPELTADILSDKFRPLDIQHLQQAICYRHAQNEIQQLMNVDYEQAISDSLTNTEKQERDLITKIASNKAWLHVLQRLEKNNSLNTHLKAFAQAVRKIGRTGVGKRALRFRKIAQSEMRECKSAVPCWIMPLYKVIESIQPGQGMYDYVIIDEASQLGADAIFLLYISKKIIIVGDDKQTSPEYIGLADNAMDPHIKHYLEGIPFNNFYGTDFSFFDHADRFCDGKIVLREHFRCMPEIIEFCNKNFYKHDGIGLYPLKQYSENRLEPLKSIYCQNGNVEGKSSSITNEPEAKRLVEEIAKCVKDKQYNGKNFGVITLQGNKQAEIIEALLLKQIGEAEFKKRNIVCGNSTSFQGDERDIIFLSLVTAHNHNRTALTKPNDERRFNVAVSRAKEQIFLFHSVQMADLRSHDDLRYKLLNHFENYQLGETIGYKTISTPPRSRVRGQQPTPFDSWFEIDVYNDIILKGYGVIAQYEVAKGRYRIDLVVILPDGTKIAIECDGDHWHGAEQYQKDMMRQRELERFEWQFFRIKGSAYYANRKKALEPLWEMLPDLTPVQAEPKENEKLDELPITSTSINTRPEIKPLEGQLDLFGDTDDDIAIIDRDTQRTKSRRRQEATTNQRGEFLIFTNQFNVYKLKNTGYTKVQTLEKIKAEFGQGEKKLCAPILIKEKEGFLIIAFENGKMAKVNLSEYYTIQNRRKLTKAYNSLSKLVSIEYFKNETDLVAISATGKILVFNTEIIPTQGRNAQGVKVIKLNNGSTLEKVKKLTTVSFSDPEYYRFKNRGSGGNKLLKGDMLVN